MIIVFQSQPGVWPTDFWTDGMDVPLKNNKKGSTYRITLTNINTHKQTDWQKDNTAFRSWILQLSKGNQIQKKRDHLFSLPSSFPRSLLFFKLIQSLTPSIPRSRYLHHFTIDHSFHSPPATYYCPYSHLEQLRVIIIIKKKSGEKCMTIVVYQMHNILLTHRTLSHSLSALANKNWTQLIKEIVVLGAHCTTKKKSANDVCTTHRGEKVKSVVLKTTQSLNTQTGRHTCDIPSGVISLTLSRLYDSYHVLYTCHVFISRAKGKRVKRQNDNQEPLTILLGTIGQLIKGGVCAEKKGMCVNVDVDVVRRNRQNREQWKGTCTAVVGCLTEPNKKKGGEESTRPSFWEQKGTKAQCVFI